MGEDKFYIVNERSLPEIFKKVIEVKENIELGNAKDISEAIKLVGISRSTYYKYKDDVFPMAQDMQSKKVTLILLMTHKSGTLSKVLDCIAFYKGNILTINQDIPINLSANVTVTIDIFIFPSSDKIKIICSCQHHSNIFYQWNVKQM